MATTRQGGAGIATALQALVGSNFTSRYSSYNSNLNEFALGSGETWLVPAGQWYVTLGLYSFLQTLDPITGLWRSLAQTLNVPRYVSSDGASYRVANLTGCAVGAFITNVGSGYTNSTLSSSGALTNTNPITVTVSAGTSAFTAIVGGAIATNPTIGTAGAGYTHKPILLVEPPPPGGVQATIIAAVSGGAISAVTVIDQGAGYQSAPRITVIPDPRDTVTTEAAITTSISGSSGQLTALLCTDQGTPLTSVATLSFSGGGGSSAAATLVGCYTVTAVATSGTTGAGGGNAQPYLITLAGGRVAGAAGAVVNPAIGVGLLNPRTGFVTGTTTAGGAAQDTGQVVEDGGLFSRVPTAFYQASGTSALWTTLPIGTATIGGATDTVFIQPA